MAGKIPREFIQDLLARIDLVDLIHTRVPLKAAGANFTARCPFHNEKSPSFTVSRTKQFYHCFGCGVSGNAIDFLIAYDRMGFPEAIETLAHSVGLSLPDAATAKSQTDPTALLAQAIYGIQDRAARFYQNQFKQHPDAARAVDYLKKRGITGESARQFRIGFAPPGWHSLPGDWPSALLESAGLLVAKDGKHYDRFRDRVMFPIRDRRGRVVGFGGRVLGDEQPKYLNSPETPVFKKQREVYGLWELLQTVRKPSTIIVVEGYLDVVALAQHQIPNAVATLGTATTSDHIQMLFRYTDDLVFCFDGDQAGQNAAWKALDASLGSLREGRQVRFLTLPSTHDPDSYVRDEGRDAFLELVKNAKAFSEFLFDRLTVDVDLSVIEGRAALLGSARPLIEKIPSGVFRDLIEQKLRSLTGYAKSETPNTAQAERPPNAANERPGPSAIRLFLTLLAQNPELAELIDQSSRKRLQDRPKLRAILTPIFRAVDQERSLTTGRLMEYLRDDPAEPIIAKLLAWNVPIPPEGIRAEFLDTLRAIDAQTQAQRLNELIERSKNRQLSKEEKDELLGLTTKP